MEAQTKHLEFLQAIIARMAGNSFQMKGWNVALASAAIGLAATKDSKPSVAVLAVIPVLAFWFLDGYYLALEVAYRELYNSAIGKEPSFSMKGPVTAGLWVRSLLRPSVVGLHAPMLLLIVVLNVATKHFVAVASCAQKP